MKLQLIRQLNPKVGRYQDVYRFTNRKEFVPIATFSHEVIEEVFNFAYDMSFGRQGHHRNHRTGGNNRRRNGEIFADTFQGKLAEFALWSVLNDNGVLVPRPDLEMYEEGVWDSSDFEYLDRKIAVKSTKSFGQLLLLEAEDWNEEGLYIPNLNTNNELYHYFVLIRLEPYTADILRQNRLYFNDICNRDALRELIMEQEFTYDIPGYMTRNDLVQLIENNYFIPQGAFLNRIGPNNIMDADNYYIQAGNLHNIQELIEMLQNL
ncbi:hypothetical protein [Bacillus sp. AFS041924]|uniref:hypothetical protein n=1 Tax=Bacillus sp. AFS041924 TaxID=2033503 RepID=UPI000BFC9DD4|nr:hypothetical protein [Bacillus sp. AFS041924]PGS54241.1 hypothetical protein COC46_05915 [Bacillus sp. AFS041924]